MKRRKRKPILLISTVASMMLISAASTASARGIYQEYNTDGISQPAVAVLMQGLSHKVYPWDSRLREDSALTLLATADAAHLPAIYQAGSFPGSGGGNDDPASEGSDDSADSGSAGIYPTADESGLASPSDGTSFPEGTSSPDAASSPEASSPDGTSFPNQTGPAPDPAPQDPQEPLRYEFTEVTQDYFDDACIIGDSRAVGIQLYSGWDNITYYAESGMTVYNLFTRKVTLSDGTEATIEEALQERSFGKIYLEIGINEMGTGTVDSFMEAYQEVVDRLRQLQPEADLFLCGIMYVRQSKSESDPIFNNPGIRERNGRIAQLADQSTIFYLDINEVTSDETGNLNPDYTWDEVHLLGKYNVLWTEYLSKHGICKTQDVKSPNRIS